MQKTLNLFILIMLTLPFGSCATKRLSNISPNFDLTKESNKCIIIGKVDISSKGVLGIPTKLFTVISKAGGESIPSFPVGEYFFIPLESGEYVIKETWISFGLLGSMGYGYPAAINLRFKATPNDIVYIGNLKVIHKFSSGGVELELTGFDKEITDEYETASREFRKRYPNIQGDIKKNLIYDGEPIITNSINIAKPGSEFVNLETNVTKRLEPFHDKDDAIIYIYRLSSIVGSAVKWKVQVDNNEVVKLGQNQYLVQHLSTSELSHLITHSGQTRAYSNFLPNRYYVFRLKGFSLKTGLLSSDYYEEIKKCENNTPGSWNVENDVQPVLTAQIVSVASLDYDWRTGKGSALDGITVQLNNWGFCGGKEVKSGWINVDTWGFYTDVAGDEKKVLLKKVTFWVNDSGKNWLDFSVGKVLLDGLDENPINLN